MATTPPPRARIHTPPTPLHGAASDNWEPYSPRRSSRVAAQKSKHPLDLSSRQLLASTPRRGLARHLSPPSSPHSPSAANNNILSVPKIRRSPQAALQHRGIFRSVSPAGPEAVVTAEALGVQPTRPTTRDPFGMLPTPAKTPRKRNALSDAAMKNTARVLFPGRPANIADAMPTPRKTKRNNRIDNGFTISALAEEGDDEGPANGIPIYTDSKERVPSVGGDDNPFLSRNSRKRGLGGGDGGSRRKGRAKSGRDARMEEAVEKDEGIVYVFRGKKILRKYDEPAPTSSEVEDTLSDIEMTRKAGSTAERPFTRSNYKPRLLFPNDEQRRAREAAEEADEEALTDIEVPQRSPRKSKPLLSTQPPSATSASANRNITPTKETFSTQPTTPPSATRRTTRAKATPRPADTEVAPAQPDAQFPPASPARSSSARSGNIFSSWARTKAGGVSAGSKGTKREGEPLAQGAGKRTRAGVAPAI